MSPEKLFSGSRHALTFINREALGLVMLPNNKFPKPHEFGLIAHRPGVSENLFAFEVEENKHRGCPDPIYQQRVIFLQVFFSVEIYNGIAALSIDPDNLEILAKVILDFDLVKNCGFNFMTPGAFGIVEHHEYCFFPALPGGLQFFPQVTEALLEKMFLWIASRRMTGNGRCDANEKNCQDNGLAAS